MQEPAIDRLTELFRGAMERHLAGRLARMDSQRTGDCTSGDRHDGEPMPGTEQNVFRRRKVQASDGYHPGHAIGHTGYRVGESRNASRTLATTPFDSLTQGTDAATQRRDHEPSEAEQFEIKCVRLNRLGKVRDDSTSRKTTTEPKTPAILVPISVFPIPIFATSHSIAVARAARIRRFAKSQ